MIGNAKRPAKIPLLSRTQHYVSLDGGSGAHLLTALDGQTPMLQRVASPRHADLLVVIAPISKQLAPATAEFARALPQPAHVLIVDAIDDLSTQLDKDAFTSLAEIFPAAQHLVNPSLPQLLDAALHAEHLPILHVSDDIHGEEDTIQMPFKQEQELATELVVLSLGPIQPFTAGPLRLLLICDGEQVLSVQVQTGYAQRGIAQAMSHANWQQGLALARQFDPLAPIASQLVYVRTLEQLQGRQPATEVEAARAMARAYEQAENTLWWLTRFTRLIADAPLANRAYRLALEMTRHVQMFSDAGMWGRGRDTSVPTSDTGDIIAGIDALRRYVEHNRGFGLRTRGIGTITTHQLHMAGITAGPIWQASVEGKGDVQSRILTRLQNAHRALSEYNTAIEPGQRKNTLELSYNDDKEILAGDVETTVEGPRGPITLRMCSDGGQGPTSIEWHGPSSALLTLLPDVLKGQILADAEIIVASLDLVMAEVDG